MAVGRRAENSITDFLLTEEIFKLVVGHDFSLVVVDNERVLVSKLGVRVDGDETFAILGDKDAIGNIYQLLAPNHLVFAIISHGEQDTGGCLE